MKDKHLVIIDTVGMSQRDRNLSEQIAMLAGVQAPVQRVLLLNGASHGDTLNEVVHAYRHDAVPEGGGVDGCIISKLDEATHLGSVLDVVIRHRLPVFYVSTGQRVPEHLELAQGPSLVERAFLTPRRGSVFADADAARRQAGTLDEAPGRQGGADDVLRSLTDSADALGQCVSELNASQHGFDLARQLWQQRTATPALRPMAQQVREAVCRDVNRECELFVLSLSATLQVPVPGRRTPQSMLHTLWLGDRNGRAACRHRHARRARWPGHGRSRCRGRNAARHPGRGAACGPSSRRAAGGCHAGALAAVRRTLGRCCSQDGARDQRRCGVEARCAGRNADVPRRRGADGARPGSRAVACNGRRTCA